MTPAAFLLAGIAAASTRGLAPVQPDTPVKSELYARRVALVVGIGDYEDDTLDLAYAVDDARAVAEVLRDRFGFDDIRTLVDGEATRDGVLQALSDLGDLSPDDALFIFWAGHGLAVETSTGEPVGYLVPWDGSTDPARVPVQDLSMSDVRSLVGRTVPARHRFLVVDACYAGLLATREARHVPDADAAWLARNSARDAFQVLTAGQADEAVLDIGPDGHSVFTARLLSALGSADDYLTASELAVEVQRAVRADAFERGSHGQTPAFGRIAGTGEFVFVPKDVALVGVPMPSGPRTSRALAWSSAASLVVGVVGLSAAAITRDQYGASPLSAGPQPERVQLNRIAGGAGYAALGASGVLLSTAVWVGRW